MERPCLRFLLVAGRGKGTGVFVFVTGPGGFTLVGWLVAPASSLAVGW